ncbi:PaaI family thioesterase [Thermodesulfobacteriota bacterium]
MIDRKSSPVLFAQEVVGRDPFSRFLGMEVEEVRDSYAKVSLVIKEEYCNAERRSHGGVLFSLADQALGVAINSRGYLAFGLEVKINYFDAARPGDVIYAEATPEDIRKRVSLWNIQLKNQNGDRIALAHGLAYHMLE